MTSIVHPSGLNPRVVAKVVARRGRLHAFETLNPATTALVMIDLTTASVNNDETCRSAAFQSNRIAGILRQKGGTICWVTPAADGLGAHTAAIVGEERAALFTKSLDPNNPESRLWHELDVQPSDIQAQKRGASAFFPGKCPLPDLLSARGTDTVLIAGTVTNVCCESSARDAVELGYRVIMVSDALAGHAFGLHEASLTTFYRIFGDVRPTNEILDLIESR